MEPILKTENLWKLYHAGKMEVPALRGVNFEVQPGEYVAIVGPSGSGKSSLFRLLLGFERPESGAVFYDGKSIETLDASALLRQLGVGRGAT